MTLFDQHLDGVLGVYVAIVFLLPWIIFMYWVVRFHFAVKKVMGSAYSSWEAFKQSPKYAAENKEFGEVFAKRNRCFVAVMLIWFVGFAGLVCLIYLANKHKVQVVSSNDWFKPTVAGAPPADAHPKG